MMFRHFTPTPPLDQLIGHRGIAALAPENTMASFKLAASHKVSWIEFDVRLTKDHELVIFHDDTLERTTNGNGYVYEHNLRELLALDAGSWFDPAFSGERIPVFSEVFSDLLTLGLQCNIEMKFPLHPTPDHIAMLANRLCLILQKWPAMHPLPLVSSFEWEALELIRRQFPMMPIGFLTEHCTQDVIAKVAKTPNAALHCDYLGLTPSLLAMAHDFHVPVLAYTVNEASIASHLFDQRVFGLFSDNPLQLRRE